MTSCVKVGNIQLFIDLTDQTSTKDIPKASERRVLALILRKGSLSTTQTGFVAVHILQY